jgi:hypothetical protein
MSQTINQRSVPSLKHHCKYVRTKVERRLIVWRTTLQFFGRIEAAFCRYRRSRFGADIFLQGFVYGKMCGQYNQAWTILIREKMKGCLKINI